MNIGIYDPKAGSRHCSGKSVYVRELARHLVDDVDVYLYTETGANCSLAVPLADSDVTVVWDDHAGSDRPAAIFAQRLLPLRERDMPTLLAAASPLTRRLRRHIERTVDVLVTNYYFDDLLLSNRLSVPTVYIYHGVPTTGLGGWGRELYSQTAVTVANAPNTAREVRATFGRDVDGIVYPGVDTERFTPDVDPVVVDGAAGDDLVVLFVGRLIRDKGVFDLVDAFAPLADDAVLWFVGGRGEADALRERADGHGIADSVRFHGPVPHDELHRYYAASDVFCSPTYYDSFGLTNIEAMACGRPVVTTNLPGIQEYASDGENALLVEPGDIASLSDRLDDLLSAPSQRERIGKAARCVAEQFAWKRQARALEYYCLAAIERAGNPIPSPSNLPSRH